MEISTHTRAKVNICYSHLLIACTPACNDCYGPSSAECNNCTEIFVINETGDKVKGGYLFSNNECRIPKCPLG